MSESLKIALAQSNLLVGDVQGNASRVIETARLAHTDLGADLVLFPELALSGYPPEDLLFHRGFRRQIEAGLARVRAEVGEVAVMLGFPEYTRAGIYNSAALIARRRDRRHPSQVRAPQLQGIRREALLPPGHAADRRDGRRLQGRDAGLRGHLGAGERAAGARRRRASCSSSSMPRRTRSTSSASARRSRAPASSTSACRSCTSTWSAARTSWSSTATRSSWTRRAQVVMRAPAVRRRHLRRRSSPAPRTAGRSRVPARWRPSSATRRACTTPWCSACATTCRSTASRASSWACRAASTPR